MFYTQNSGEVLSQIEKSSLLVLVASTLLPIKNLQYLIVTGLLVMLVFAFITKYANKQILQYSVWYLFSVILLNLLFGQMSIVVLKPVWMLFILTTIVTFNERLSYQFYEKLVLIFFCITMFFFMAHALGYSVISNLYRVTTQLDLIHLKRLTAPFLNAGDYGVVCFFLALLSFSFGTKKYNIIGSLFLILIVFTQSRLALAGIPFVILFLREFKYKAYAIIVTLITSYFINVYSSSLIENFSYLNRFFDRIDFYLEESKRAEEYFYLIRNFDSILLHGTDEFVLARGLTTAESSLVSMAVKIGILPTILFWLLIGHVFFKKLSGGLLLFAIIFFFAIFSAPLDRPKSSILVAVCIAGISVVRRSKSADGV